MFPIFEKKTGDQPSSSTFQWLKPSLGTHKTCLHAVNLSPESRAKVAAFDLDGCVIQSGFSKKAKGGAPPTFQWWRPGVPKKLREVYESG